MDRWTPRFDFYFSTRDGWDCSTFVDLEARKHSPVASHPVALRASLEMKEPRPDGLRSAEEAPALFEFEDRLIDRLSAVLDAIYVGRIVHRGRTDLLFYLPPSTQAEPASVASDLEPYRLSFTRVLDRTWDGYAKLYPGERERQQIRDRQLLEVLQQRGDRPEVPRDVDHMAYFDQRGAAEAAARDLAALGFQLFGTEVNEREGRFAVTFHRVETCRPRDVSRFVGEILDVVLRLGGDYDGWGCEVQRPRDGSAGTGGP